MTLAPGINLVIVEPDYFRIADNAGIDQSMAPSALIGSNPRDESIVSGLPVILDDIHFGQGRASRIRFSGEISKQESEYASPRLRFEKRLDGIVFCQESADKQAAEDGRRVRRGRWRVSPSTRTVTEPFSLCDSERTRC
jgi:hypothetical protein